MDDWHLYKEIIELKGEYWHPKSMSNTPFSVEDSLSLLDHIDKAEITRVFTAGKNWQWFVRLPVPNTERFVDGTRLQDSVHSIDYNLSRAICEAWLLWMRHGQKLEY